jgi:hypothetical protein
MGVAQLDPIKLSLIEAFNWDAYLASTNNPNRAKKGKKKKEK